MREPTPAVYEFGPFVLDGARRLLLRNGTPQALSPKVLDTLLALVAHRDRVLTKDELLEHVWGDTIVEEGGLARNISLLRKTLGETPDDHRFIVTLPARGYRFVADVRVSAAAGTPPVEEASDGDEGAGPEHASPAVTADGVRIHARRSRWWRRTAAGGVAAVLAVGAAVGWTRMTAVPAAPGPIASIAVLPLDNLSGDPAQEYLADGLTEALIGQLARIRALKVVSRTSIMRFKGARPAIAEIARTLGVDGVIEGSIHRGSGRVRVSIQLIHAPTDAHLWAREYERPEDDLLRLQSEVARAVADEIRVQISDRDRGRMAAGIGTLSPEAHREYLLGQHYLWKRMDEDLVRAIAHFERATRLDAGFAAAYAGASHAWWWRGVVGPSSLKDVEPASRAAAERALALDPRLPEALVSLGRVKYGHDWDWAGAQRHFRSALELDPNNLDALFFSGMACMAIGCFDEAIGHMERASQIDPLSSEVQSAYGRILYRARRFEEAIPHLAQAISLEPRNAAAYTRLADVYRELRRFPDALAVLEKADAVGQPVWSSDVSRAHIYARVGNRAEAKRLLDQVLQGVVGTPQEGAISVAAAHAALGDHDEAFRLLHRNVETRGSWAAYTKTDPGLEPLRADPRWPVLLRRLNLPAEGE